MDMHHYHAWKPACHGASDRQGKYTCGNVAQRDDALARCTSWATHAFVYSLDEECRPGARLASAEFSASTHHLVPHACNDIQWEHCDILINNKLKQPRMQMWNSFGGPTKCHVVEPFDLPGRLSI